MPNCLRLFFNSGTAQSVTVFCFANLLYLPRWFDYKVVDPPLLIDDTWLRGIYNYNFYYVGIITPMCILAIPLTIIVVSTILMMRKLQAVTATLSSPKLQKNQEKRNRSISVMLIGIIILFVICQLPKLIMTIYQGIVHGAGKNDYNNDWVQVLDVMKNTLVVTNSSLNFAIYCKDLLFRKLVWNICNKFFKCLQPESTASCDKPSGQISALEVLSEPETAQTKSNC